MSREYIVVFKTKRNLPMPQAYEEMSEKLFDLAKSQKGFKGIESFADTKGNGLSVSYWDSLEAIKAWKQNSVHLEAQRKGKTDWYEHYIVEICEVIRKYEK